MNLKRFVSLGTDEAAPPAKRIAVSIPRLLDGKYFSITKREKFKVDAMCTICGRPRKGDIRSTGNFMDHFKNAHAHLVKEVEDYRRKNSVEIAVINDKQKTLTSMIRPFRTEEVFLYLV